jgi:parallel beta-helix repeat protein
MVLLRARPSSLLEVPHGEESSPPPAPFSLTGTLLAALLVASFLSVSPRAVGGNCPAANPDDDLTDDVAINECLSQGGDVLLDVGYGYIIQEGLYITVPGTRLMGPPSGAIFRAHVTLRNRMLTSDGVDDVELHNVHFYGNKYERGFRLPDCHADQGNRDWAKNILLVGNRTVVANSTSSEALCGTAMEIGGWDFEVRDSVFADNGFESGGPEPWADGLTVWGCFNGWIHDNEFSNNTDIDLVVGGGSGCVIENNTMTNTSTHAFGGFHVGWFPMGDGDHNGNVYRWNNMSAGYDKMAFGTIVGFHPWGLQVTLPHAGSTTDNHAAGAVVNLAVDGISAGEVQRNSWGGAQGNRGFGCSLPAAEYTVAPGEYGAASLQDGWISRWFHNGTCGS